MMYPPVVGRCSRPSIDIRVYNCVKPHTTVLTARYSARLASDCPTKPVSTLVIRQEFQHLFDDLVD